jgi:hypothetical protein
LVSFLKSYFSKELHNMQLSATGKKVPVERKDFVADARERKID